MQLSQVADRRKGRDNLFWQPGQLKVARQPNLRNFQPLRHRLLLAAIIELNRSRVVDRTLVVRNIFSVPVFNISKAKRLFIGQIAHLNQILELLIVTCTQPSHRKMATRAADDFVVMCPALHTAYNRWELLTTLGSNALNSTQ